MAVYKANNNGKIWKKLLASGVPEGQILDLKIADEVIGGEKYVKGSTGWVDVTKVNNAFISGVTKAAWLTRTGETQPPSPPVVVPSGFYIVLGDEYLADFNFESRTLGEHWVYNEETPCIFRYNPTPTTPTELRTDVVALEADIDRINGWTDAKNNRAYYRSGGTAFFNAPRPGTKYPKQLNATMANNILEPLAIEGKYLKFKTIKPTDNVSHMTAVSHPQFVHKWDIVKGVKQPNGIRVTQHKDTPHGRMYYFMVSNSGYGYIPLKWVKKI